MTDVETQMRREVFRCEFCILNGISDEMLTQSNVVTFNQLWATEDQPILIWMWSDPVDGHGIMHIHNTVIMALSAYQVLSAKAKQTWWQRLFKKI